MLTRRPDAVREKFRRLHPRRGRPDDRRPLDGRRRRLRRRRQPCGREHLRPALERRLQAPADGQPREDDRQRRGGPGPQAAPTPARPRCWSTPRRSAIYGPHGDEELDEDARPATTTWRRFAWRGSRSARAAEAAGVRVALVRIGVVLDREGGALAQLLTPFKLFAGGPVGSGRQWMALDSSCGRGRPAPARAGPGRRAGAAQRARRRTR